MRISREELKLRLVDLVAQRSTCPRANVGCAIFKDGRVVVTGYNSSPAGMDHCSDVGCLMEQGKCIRTVHAEAGAISFAAREGISLKDTEMYLTFSPCIDCAKLIVNSGIKAVYYLQQYRIVDGIILLQQAGIICERKEPNG